MWGRPLTQCLMHFNMRGICVKSGACRLGCPQGWAMLGGLHCAHSCCPLPGALTAVGSSGAGSWPVGAASPFPTLPQGLSQPGFLLGLCPCQLASPASPGVCPHLSSRIPGPSFFSFLESWCLLGACCTQNVVRFEISLHVTFFNRSYPDNLS